ARSTRATRPMARRSNSHCHSETNQRGAPERGAPVARSSQNWCDDVVRCRTNRAERGRDLVDERHDVVIVGGGIMGATTLYEFARRGVDVLLLEQDPAFGGRD